MAISFTLTTAPRFFYLAVYYKKVSFLDRTREKNNNNLTHARYSCNINNKNNNNKNGPFYANG